MRGCEQGTPRLGAAAAFARPHTQVAVTGWFVVRFCSSFVGCDFDSSQACRARASLPGHTKNVTNQPGSDGM
jgi:hypothetical protein